MSIDANVLISAIKMPRWPYEIVRAALSGDIVLAIPGQVLDEADRHLPGRYQRKALESVIRSPGFELLEMPRDDRVQQNLDLVRSQNDVPIALALLDADVDLFVTSDRDFTDPGSTADRFRERVQVMLPAVFLREVLGWSSDDLEAIRFRRWTDISPPPP